jgi:hypothetical protein
MIEMERFSDDEVAEGERSRRVKGHFQGVSTTSAFATWDIVLTVAHWERFLQSAETCCLYKLTLDVVMREVVVPVPSLKKSSLN